MQVTDADVERYARFITGHQDAKPDAVQLAATRAVLGGLADNGRLLPPTNRLATLQPGDSGRASRAVVHLDGPREIFRFMVNLLGVQIDIAAAARTVLVDLRDHLTPAEFDPMARLLLGEEGYERLSPQFERDWTCRGCDETIRPGRLYVPTEDGGAVCSPCGKGVEEYRGRFVKRVASSRRTPVSA